ncbi:unnamed protein product [Caenorhabditis brenneri]
MSFPLLRLPLLASITVIKNLDVYLIIYLTRISSSKIRRLVKISKVRIKLTVYPYDVLFEKIADPGEYLSSPFFLISKRAVTLRKIPFEPIYICDKDWISRREEGYRRIINDFNNFFIVQTLQFHLKSASVCYKNLEYAKSIGLQPTTIETMLIGANEEVYQRILTSCSHVTELRVHLFEDFPFDGFSEYTVDDFRLYIPGQNINWFTVDHMCALINCRSVLVYHINWESEDFNKFLRFWMVSNGRLQSVTLWGKWSPTPDNLQVLLDKIDNRKIIENEKFEVQRVDGVKAHVACGRRGEFSLKRMKIANPLVRCKSKFLSKMILNSEYLS